MVIMMGTSYSIQIADLWLNRRFGAFITQSMNPWLPQQKHFRVGIAVHPQTRVISGAFFARFSSSRA